MINGKSLLDRSTTARKKNLEHTVRSVPGRLEIVKGWMGSTAKEVRKHMENIMNSRYVVMLHGSTMMGDLRTEEKDLSSSIP